MPIEGIHHLTYALVPGATISDAIAEGYALNIIRYGPSEAPPT